MRGSPRALRKRTVLEASSPRPARLGRPGKAAGDVIGTPNIIRLDTLGSCGRREVHRTPAFIGPRPTPTSMTGRCGSTYKDTVSRADHHGNIRIVVKFPQSREGVPKRIAGLARAYRGPLSIPRRCPLSVVKQRCGSASPGLNRVFRLLPQRLEVLRHQWPRPTDLPRDRCVGRGRQHPRQRC
jgi:hypothetical protein